MPNTAKGIPYPNTTDKIKDVPALMQAQGQAVDTLLPSTVVVKAVSEAVNASIALQNDDELSIAIPAAGTYLIEAVMFVQSAANASGDFRVGATWPAATFVHQYGQGADPGLAAGTVQSGEWKINLNAVSGNSATSYGASTSNLAVIVRWIAKFTAAGTFQVQWAQVTAAGTTTVLAGSHLHLRKAG